MVVTVPLGPCGGREVLGTVGRSEGRTGCTRSCCSHWCPAHTCSELWQPSQMQTNIFKEIAESFGFSSPTCPLVPSTL